MPLDLKKYEGANSHPLASDDKQRAYQALVMDAPELLAEVVGLRRELDSLTAERDALLLEFAPERMTKEQLEEWGKNQVPAGELLGDRLV